MIAGNPSPPDSRHKSRARLTAQFTLIGGNVAGLCLLICIVGSDNVWVTPSTELIFAVLAIVAAFVPLILPIVVASITPKRVFLTGALPLLIFLLWLLTAELIELNLKPGRDNIWRHGTSISKSGAPNLGETLIGFAVAWLVLCVPVSVIRGITAKLRSNREKKAAKAILADAARVVEGEWPPRPVSGS